MLDFEEEMIGYVRGINIRFKRWRDCNPSTLVYKIRVFSGMKQEEAEQLGLNVEQKNFFDYNW